MDSLATESNCLFKKPSECIYTSCYCEENVWHLCNWVKENRPHDLEKCYCVFISNNSKTIPLWCQKCSQQADGCVVWDYHVIFLHEADTETMVYDLDSSQEYPCKFETYANNGIRSCESFKEQYRRYFRVIKAAEFLATFASDRSHMLDENKEWLKPPPDYPCIKTQDSVNNINDFISMDSQKGIGSVKDYQQFFSDFANR